MDQETAFKLADTLIMHEIALRKFIKAGKIPSQIKEDFEKLLNSNNKLQAKACHYATRKYRKL